MSEFLSESLEVVLHFPVFVLNLCTNVHDIQRGDNYQSAVGLRPWPVKACQFSCLACRNFFGDKICSRFERMHLITIWWSRFFLFVFILFMLVFVFNKFFFLSLRKIYSCVCVLLLFFYLFGRIRLITKWWSSFFPRSFIFVFWKIYSCLKRMCPMTQWWSSLIFARKESEIRPLI